MDPLQAAECNNSFISHDILFWQPFLTSVPHDSTLLECIFNISVAIAHESATKQTKIFKVSSVKKCDIVFRHFQTVQ